MKEVIDQVDNLINKRKNFNTAYHIAYDGYLEVLKAARDKLIEQQEYIDNMTESAEKFFNAIPTDKGILVFKRGNY